MLTTLVLQFFPRTQVNGRTHTCVVSRLPGQVVEAWKTSDRAKSATWLVWVKSPMFVTIRKATGVSFWRAHTPVPEPDQPVRTVTLLVPNMGMVPSHVT